MKTSIFFVLLFLFFINSRIVGNPVADCKSYQKILGDECVSRCPLDYDSVKNNQRCFLKVDDFQKKPKLPSSCKLETLTSFFTWVAYDLQVGKINWKWGDEYGDKRIKGCGTWTIKNIVYNFDDFLNEEKDAFLEHRQYVIFVENKDLGIVLTVFRGTESTSFSDWVDSINTIKTDCPFRGGNCGKVHQGFLQTYSVSRNDTFIQMNRYLDAGYELIIAGHSQGGPTSTLCAIDYLRNFPHHRSMVRHLSLGGARVGNQDFVDAFMKTVDPKRIKRIVARHEYPLIPDAEDVVTTVPPAIFGFRHVGEKTIVNCEKESFGNFDTIRNISVYYYPESMPPVIPYSLGCHFQQVYQDGLMTKSGNR